jgi:hypothetical protein
MRLEDNYYLARKSTLLRRFDKATARVNHVLVSRYGEEHAGILTNEVRREYEAIIPHLPYIGPRNPLLFFIIPTGWHAGLYRVLQNQRRTVDEAGQVIYDLTEAYLKSMPEYVRRLIEYLWFSSLFLKRLEKRAVQSQKRKYPGDFVLQYIDGDGKTFDYGIDYIECANCKFLRALGADELAPYVCAADKLASELLGWGLTRTMTIAEGHEKCDFRFKRGGKTSVTIPSSLNRTKRSSSGLYAG